MEKKLKDMGVELNELAIAMCDYIQTGQKLDILLFLSVKNIERRMLSVKTVFFRHHEEGVQWIISL